MWRLHLEICGGLWRLTGPLAPTESLQCICIQDIWKPLASSGPAGPNIVDTVYGPLHRLSRYIVAKVPGHVTTSKANTALDVSNLGFYNNTMSQSGSGSNAGAIIQSLDVSASVVQAPAPALAVDTSTTSVDYGGTSKFIESAGMVIDCDFMRFLGETTHQTSVRNP